MEDQRIVELYWERSEQALRETQAKYANYCYAIAYNILGNREDSEESLNDTYLEAWNSMPPHRPTFLSTFLGKITRRISIDKLRHRNAEKRGGGNLTLALEELEDCLSARDDLQKELEIQILADAINRFLESLSDTERRVFLCRYWYVDSIESISEQFGFGQSKVKSMLRRTREKLKKQLLKEELI